MAVGEHLVTIDCILYTVRPYPGVTEIFCQVVIARRSLIDAPAADRGLCIGIQYKLKYKCAIKVHRADEECRCTEQYGCIEPVLPAADWGWVLLESLQTGTAGKGKMK